MNAKRPLSPPGGNQLQKRVRLTTHVPYRPCLHCGSPDHDYTKCMYECMHCTDEHFFRRCPELGVEHYEPKGFRPLLPPPTLEDQPSVVKPSTSGVVAQARQPSIETAVTQSAQVKPEPEPELAASTSVHDLPAAVLTPSPQQDSGEQDPRALCEGRRLYIGNMSYAATEADLKTFFRDYYVQSVRIPINPRTTRPVGYAFVDLYIPSQLEQAVSELDGKSLVDRKVSVQLAKPGSATPTRATSEVSGAATVKTKSRAAAVKTESRAATVKTESRAATVKTESGAVTVKTGGYPSSENRSHHTGVLKLPIAAAAAPETSTGSHHMDPSRAAMIAAALYGPQPVASKGHKQGPIYSGSNSVPLGPKQPIGTSWRLSEERSVLVQTQSPTPSLPQPTIEETANDRSGQPESELWRAIEQQIRSAVEETQAAQFNGLSERESVRERLDMALNTIRSIISGEEGTVFDKNV